MDDRREIKLTESGQAPDNWTIGITSAFRSLTFEDMPSLEVLLLI
jgi:hypothetical protein